MLCEKAKGIRMLNVSAAIQTPDRMPRRTLSDVGSPPTTPLDADESSARLNAKHNSVYLVWINSYSAMAVFVFYLVSLESWISISLSVGTTILTYSRTMGNENFDGNTMNWTLLSFAVIAPIGSALTMAFSRREMALQQTAFLRSTFFQLYLAHSIWDWNVGATAESGREKVRLSHHC